MTDKTPQQPSIYNIVYDDITSVTYCHDVTLHSEHTYVLISIRDNEYTTIKNVKIYTNTNMRGITNTCASYFMKDDSVHMIAVTEEYFNRCIAYIEDFTRMTITEYTSGRLNYMEI